MFKINVLPFFMIRVGFEFKYFETIYKKVDEDYGKGKDGKLKRFEQYDLITIINELSSF